MEPRPRQLVYAEEQTRQQSEREFSGSREAFLATLNTVITMRLASPAHLHRVTELVTRTNQLGIKYSQADLEALLASASHECWLVSLRDRFGDCGQVGFVLLAISSGCWTLELFLFSCRVLPRGVDTIVLNALLRRARAAHVRLRAHFRSTSRNESLWLAYQRAGFTPLTSNGDWHVLEHPLTSIPEHPPHARLCGAWTDGA
jgi:FkbH-like protein